jgi:hypothetical protein
MKIIPLPMVWTEDGVFKPLERYNKRADQQYAVGEVYHVTIEEERSVVSHRSYFAELKRIHDNLPDHLAQEFPSVESFRKRALIRTGYFTMRHVPCSSERQAAMVASMLGDIDEYALIEVRGTVVQMYRAKSQSVQNMKKEEFEDSKRKVLELGARLIGVTREELRRATEEGHA